MNAEQQPYGVRTADRVLDVLEALQGARNGLTLTALSRQLGLPKTSTYRYLTTLVGRGYVLRDREADRYRLAYGLRPVVAQDVARLAAAARPHLVELCRSFEETINLGILETGRVTYLEIARPREPRGFPARRGGQESLHCTALGKVLAAGLHESEVRRILRVEGMPRRTAATLTSAERYIGELRDVRRRGYAKDRGESGHTGGCLAVAVDEAPVPAAVSLSAPYARLDVRLDNERVDEAVTALRRAARAIATALAT